MDITTQEPTAAPMLNKVPEITLYFWIIKIMATTVGETAADYLNVNLGFGLTNTSWVMSGLLVAVLAYQLMRRQYVPWLYWLTVILISIVGTLITDNLTDAFGVPLWTSTAVFSVLLAVTFMAWYAAERTLSIHTIFTTRRELFYWAAILFTFALGTAGGDLATEGVGLGYMQGTLIFGGLIALTTVAYYAMGLNAVLAFWIAYILTRPLGASIGDLLSQPPADGGLGLSHFGINAVFFVIIVALIGYLTASRADRPSREEETAAKRHWAEGAHG
ncbi:hypothetical protein [Chelativorans salis]|uniref:Membrane-anchored protein n=1 Tax=Chelativorans salis TaxID=2978478 RepID=A0ABT2LU86_9HYPH|nr:hypothetical protein [Chelativorans sp. EGI FJ00035]MCT7378095.1 hypothetical protein [Chelativorans sp. EGI FJ00035]